MSLSIVTSRLRATFSGSTPDVRRARFVRARALTFVCYPIFAGISFLGMLGVIDRAPAGVRAAVTVGWMVALTGTIVFAIAGRLYNDRLEERRPRP